MTSLEVVDCKPESFKSLNMNSFKLRIMFHRKVILLEMEVDTVSFFVVVVGWVTDKEYIRH